MEGLVDDPLPGSWLKPTSKRLVLSGLVACAEGRQGGLDQRACSPSTLVFQIVPPSPWIFRRMTSMSPSLPRTKRADVPGFINASRFRTKSLLTPAASIEPMIVPAPPSAAPIGAPVRGTRTRPARKPTAVQPRRLGGDRERLSVERERSVGVPHHHRQIRKDEEVLVPPEADDLVADLMHPVHVVIADCPQLHGAWDETRAASRPSRTIARSDTRAAATVRGL